MLQKIFVDGQKFKRKNVLFVTEHFMLETINPPALNIAEKSECDETMSNLPCCIQLFRKI